MKKAIKNYLAKLHDNKKKGFSLVELIIVIAIMAILVGVVASQVIPYMEKSRQAKDQQQLSNVQTALVSAISQSPVDLANVPATKLADITDDFGATGSGVGTNLADLLHSGYAQSQLGTIQSDIKGKFKSKKGKDTGDIMVSYNNGIVRVWYGDASGANAPKLDIESE